MRVTINTCAFSLLQKVFYILQIMTADKDTWILTHTDIDLRQLGVSIDTCVGFVE